MSQNANKTDPVGLIFNPDDPCPLMIGPVSPEELLIKVATIMAAHPDEKLWMGLLQTYQTKERTINAET